tara:strand:- start:490 stop:642 length:153 start_codon:yes stop_codon:yes gene_type:complete
MNTEGQITTEVLDEYKWMSECYVAKTERDWGVNKPNNMFICFYVGKHDEK